MLDPVLDAEDKKSTKTLTLLPVAQSKGVGWRWGSDLHKVQRHR